MKSDNTDNAISSPGSPAGQKDCPFIVAIKEINPLIFMENMSHEEICELTSKMSPEELDIFRIEVTIYHKIINAHTYEPFWYRVLPDGTEAFLKIKT